MLNAEESILSVASTAHALVGEGAASGVVNFDNAVFKIFWRPFRVACPLSIVAHFPNSPSSVARPVPKAASDQHSSYRVTP